MTADKLKLQVQPMHAVGIENGNPLYEDCEDAEADVWSVFIVHSKDEWEWVEDFTTRADAEAHAGKMFAGGENDI